MSIKSTANKLLLSTALIFTSLAPAQAADKNETYAVKGAGVSYCSMFIESMQSRDKNYFVYGGWVEGYLTGLNQQLANTFDLAPWQTTELLLRIIEPICQKNPKQQFHNVVKAMAGELSQHKVSQSGNYIQVEADKNLIFQEAIITRIKAALVEKGFYVGDDNLGWDKPVITAVKDFQRSQELEETGLPDQFTLYKLFYTSNQ